KLFQRVDHLEFAAVQLPERDQNRSPGPTEHHTNGHEYRHTDGLHLNVAVPLQKETSAGNQCTLNSDEEGACRLSATDQRLRSRDHQVVEVENAIAILLVCW